MKTLLLSLIFIMSFATTLIAGNDTIPNQDIDFRKSCIENTNATADIETRIDRYTNFHVIGVAGVLAGGVLIITTPPANGSTSGTRPQILAGIIVMSLGALLMIGAPFMLKKKRIK